MDLVRRGVERGYGAGSGEASKSRPGAYIFMGHRGTMAFLASRGMLVRLTKS